MLSFIRGTEFLDGPKRALSSSKCHSFDDKADFCLFWPFNRVLGLGVTNLISVAENLIVDLILLPSDLPKPQRLKHHNKNKEDPNRTLIHLRENRCGPRLAEDPASLTLPPYRLGSRVFRTTPLHPTRPSACNPKAQTPNPDP